jgi:integrase
MPRKAEELSARAVSSIKEEGRHPVGGAEGLYLQVAGGSRTWILRVAIGTRINKAGKAVAHRPEIGLGSYPAVTLAEAREKARAYRKQARDGVDLLAARKEAKALALAEAEKNKTFEQAAPMYIAAQKEGWKNAKHIQQWENTLATYAYPIIGSALVADIDTDMVLKVLLQEVDVKGKKAPFWYAKAETASRLRGRIEAILDWSKFRKFRQGDNPARWKGHLEHELPSRNKVQRVRNHPALPYTQICAFMVELRQREGVSPRALEFTILTAARSSEAFGATWDEIDLEAKLWVIPKERMKAEKEHRIPLSEEAVGLLKALPRVGRSRLVFVAPSGGKLSDMSLTSLIRRMHASEVEAGRRGFLDPRQNRVATTHGFRSTFRDWAGEMTPYPREVCEHALAHLLEDETEAAYQRGDLLMKRAALMKDWATYCGAPAQ